MWRRQNEEIRRDFFATNLIEGNLTAANLGGPYADGLLVVQDGHKRLPQGPQNFKLVPWREVEKAVMR